MRQRVRRRSVLFTAAALPVAFLVLLFVEAQVAASGPKVEETTTFTGSGRFAPGDPASCGGTAPAPANLVLAGGRRVDLGPSPRPVRMAWLGDSTAAGVGASSPARTLPVLVACGLGPGRTVELSSYAVSGARVEDVLERQLPALLAAGPLPDMVVIDVGANDVTHLTRVNAFRNAYLAILNQLVTGTAVIVLGVPDLGSATRLPQPLRFVAGWRGGTYDAVVEAMRDHDADYVNIADFTGPAFSAEPDRYFAADHYHPNDEGYALWARTVLPVVQWRLYKVEHPTDEEPLMPKEAKGTIKGDAP